MAEGYLNNYIADITKHSTTSNVTVNYSLGTDSIDVWKIGNVVTMNIRSYNITTPSSLSGTTTLFTLPSGYRPNHNVVIVGAGSTTTDFNSSVPVLFTIYTDGAIRPTFSGTYYQIWITGCFPMINM